MRDAYVWEFLDGFAPLFRMRLARCLWHCDTNASIQKEREKKEIRLERQKEPPKMNNWGRKTNNATSESEEKANANLKCVAPEMDVLRCDDDKYLI